MKEYEMENNHTISEKKNDIKEQSVEKEEKKWWVRVREKQKAALMITIIITINSICFSNNCKQ